MASDGTITASTAAGDQATLNFPAGNYSSTGSGTRVCDASPIKGCASNPFVLNATLNVATGTPAGTPGTLTVAQSGTGIGNGSAATGYVQVYSAPPADNPPSDPGAPATSSALNNDGLFTLSWAASTVDDGDTITYTLEHANASGTWSTVASGISDTSYSFGSGGNSAEDEGTWSYRVTANDSGGLSSNPATSLDLVKVDETSPNAPLASIDPPSAYTDAGGNSWYEDSVTVGFTGNGDPPLADGSDGSGVDSSLTTASATFDSTNADPNTGAFSIDGTVTDFAGNTSDKTNVSGYVDWKTPTASFSDCPSSVTLNSTGSVDWTASDAAPSSGLATDASGSVDLDTSTIGQHTIDSPAPSDNVGHTGTGASCTYNVIYNWTGFFQPVDNLPTVNTVQAGSGVPVKFSLSGNQGLGIFAAGYPKLVPMACGGLPGDTTDAIETTTSGASGLSYDPTSDQYTYVWKTQKAWAGTCGRLDVQLIDGTTHSAYFSFKK